MLNSDVHWLNSTKWEGDLRFKTFVLLCLDYLCLKNTAKRENKGMLTFTNTSPFPCKSCIYVMLYLSSYYS